ncbi:MAG: hypothetical protein EXR71_01200 [Myxococcales bacterium]|nr:hypothetical protein [Myxococcales bacterium]
MRFDRQPTRVTTVMLARALALLLACLCGDGGPKPAPSAAPSPDPPSLAAAELEKTRPSLTETVARAEAHLAARDGAAALAALNEIRALVVTFEAAPGPDSLGELGARFRAATPA